MIHGDIVLFCSLFLLLLVLNFQLGHLRLEYLLPFLTKSLHIDKFFIFYTSIQGEHGGVSISKLKVYFAHLPLEGAFVEFREIFGNYGNKQLTYFLKLGKVVVAIELERTIHDSTVVKCSYSKSVCRFKSASFHTSVRFILNASHYTH